MARASLDPTAGDPTGGGALLSAAVAAARRGYDGAAIVEAAWIALHGAGKGSRLVERRQQLVTGLALLDRFAAGGAGRRGAGVQLVVERMVSDRFDVDDRDAGDYSLFSLGGVASWAWSTGRSWRRAARGANAGRPPRRPLGLNPRRRRRDWPWPEW